MRMANAFSASFSASRQCRAVLMTRKLDRWPTVLQLLGISWEMRSDMVAELCRRTPHPVPHYRFLVQFWQATYTVPITMEVHLLLLYFCVLRQSDRRTLQ